MIKNNFFGRVMSTNVDSKKVYLKYRMEVFNIKYTYIKYICAFISK